MLVLKCKICGGSLNVQEGMTVCTCEYCGSQQNVAPEEHKTETVIQQVTIVNNGAPERSAELENLLKAGNMDLQDEKYDAAREAFEKVIGIDCECADAYLGQMLANLHINKEKFEKWYIEDDINLIFYANPDWRKTYERVKNFAAGATKEWADALEQQKKERKAALEAEGSARVKTVRERNCKANGFLYKAGNGLAAVKLDGTVLTEGPDKFDTSDWEDIAAVTEWFDGTTQKYQLIGRKTDGTVVTTGKDVAALKEIAGWDHIIDIKQWGTIYGLRDDGTVVMTGDVNPNMPKIAKWKDIAAIEVNWNHVTGLTKDGTVVAVGDNRERQCNTTDWKEVVAIKATGSYTAGLRSDGTVVSTGEGYIGEIDTADWTDVVELCADSNNLIGLKGDGTVVVEANNRALLQHTLNWQDILTVEAGGENFLKNHIIVGLKADGTLVDADMPFGVRGNVIEWEDIVAMKVLENGIAGLKADGTVVVSMAKGGIDVSGWRLFQSIDTLEEERKALVRRRAQEKEEERLRIIRKREEEHRKREEKHRQLEEEKARLTGEAENLKGIFSGKRRREIEKRLAELERELDL